MTHDWVSYLITICAGGAAGALITYFLNRKGNKKSRELKEKELKLKNRELEIKEEEQRLRDMPDLRFGNTMMSSPLSGELKIEISNVGSDCTITNIDAAKINGRLLSPKLPTVIKGGSSVMLELLLPKGSKVLQQTFPKYSLNFTVVDIHQRVYTCDFIVNNLGKVPGISITPLKFKV